MKLLKIRINKEEEILVNLFVIIIFGFFNPFYAISILAILNLLNQKINYRLFSFMFTLSFTLLFYLRDWGEINSFSDGMQYIRMFQMVGNQSISEIFYQFVLHPKGQEPFWFVYLWLLRILIGNNVEIFLFSNYFIIFLLTAYLGKLVDGKRYVVVIFCIISVNPGFLYNLFEVWRHTFALLLFFIGIFLFEKNKSKLLSRSWMYSSMLFHLVSFPLVLLYELFIIFDMKEKPFQRSYRSQKNIWYSIRIIIYILFIVSILKLSDTYGAYVAPSLRLSSVFDSYVKNIGSELTGYYFLINPLSIVVIFYFWFNKKHISKNDIFIGINYFLFIVGLMILSLPSSPMGRILYVFFVGASILSSKLILTDFRLGLICLLIIIWHQFNNILSQPESASSIVLLLNGAYLNPVYGIIKMVLNYDTLLVLPKGV